VGALLALALPAQTAPGSPATRPGCRPGSVSPTASSVCWTLPTGPRPGFTRAWCCMACSWLARARGHDRHAGTVVRHRGAGLTPLRSRCSPRGMVSARRAARTSSTCWTWSSSATWDRSLLNAPRWWRPGRRSGARRRAVFETGVGLHAQLVPAVCGRRPHAGGPGDPRRRGTPRAEAAAQARRGRRHDAESIRTRAQRPRADHQPRPRTPPRYRRQADALREAPSVTLRDRASAPRRRGSPGPPA